MAFEGAEIKKRIRFWEKEYSRLKKNYRKIITSKKEQKILCGFNANIDSIIKLDSKFSKRFTDFVDDKGLSQELLVKRFEVIKQVKNEYDLYSALFHSVRNSSELELRCSDEFFVDWLKKNFNIRDSRIGGQAGIVSSFYSYFTNVIFYSTNTTSEILDKLPKNLRFLTKEGILNRTKMKEYISRNKKLFGGRITKNNFIFEFSKGYSLLGFKSDRGNRFILSTDGHDYPYFGVDFNLESLKEIDKFFLSGYHHLPYDKRRLLDISARELKNIRRINRKTLIHLEDTHMGDLRMKKEIIKKIWPLVDSIGMNEYELSQTLKVFSFLRYKNYERKNKCLVCSLKSLAYLMKKTKLKRASLHTYKFQILGVRKGMFTNIFALRDHLLLSYLMSSAKAGKDDFNILNSIKDLEGEICFETIGCLKDMEKKFKFLDEGIIDYGDFIFVVVPSFTSKHIKYTVGLGDIVSSSSFYLY